MRFPHDRITPLSRRQADMPHWASDLLENGNRLAEVSIRDRLAEDGTSRRRCFADRMIAAEQIDESHLKHIGPCRDIAVPNECIQVKALTTARRFHGPLKHHA